MINPQEIQKLKEQLTVLRLFPKRNQHVVQLRNQIKLKLKKLEQKLSKPDPKPVDRVERQRKANESRSRAQKKRHQFIRLIHQQLQDKYSYQQVTQQLAQRRQQKQVEIPDVVWQNPSP